MIFENFDQTQDFFEKFPPKIEIFKKISNKMAIYRKFRPKSRYFENCDQNRDFSKNLTPIEISPKYLPKWRFFENSGQNRDFSKITTKIAIFENFERRSRFSKLSNKFGIFKKKFRPKLTFLEDSEKIEIWFCASTFWCGDIKGIGRYVINDFIVCYSLWLDAMNFELQHFLPFHCSSSVRVHTINIVTWLYV